MNKTEVKGKLKDNKLPEGWTKNIIANLFFLGRGRVISEKEIVNNEGIYSVFSSQTSNKGELGKIISYDFEGEHITWTTDGANAGTVFYRSGRFNCTNVCGTLKARSENIYVKFFAYLLSTQAKKYVSYIGNPKLMNNTVAKILLFFPSFLPEQKKIAKILETVDEAIEKTNAIIEKCKRIKQGFMQDLLTEGITAFEFEKDKLIHAVKKVFDSGDHRFGREENLVSHLSRHLNEFFPGWNVDSEVEKNSDRQRPDIIIHKRRMDENLFAIEVKKNENLNAIKKDIKKLEDVMLGDYHYEDVVFIGFDIENFEDVFKLSEKVNFILVSKNGEIKVKSRVRRFKDSTLGRIPEDWDVVNIKDICKVRQGLQIAIANRFKESGSKRYIYITIRYLNSKEKDKDAEYIQNPPKNVLCGKNDLLMTRTGNTGMIITDVEGVFHNNFFLMDYYIKQVNKIYLFYYLNLPWVQEKVRALAGTTTIPDLNHGDFYSLKFLKPELLEQQRIALILSQIDETIGTEQNYKQKLERIKQGLMGDLLTGKVRVNHLIKEGVENV